MDASPPEISSFAPYYDNLSCLPTYLTDLIEILLMLRKHLGSPSQIHSLNRLPFIWVSWVVDIVANNLLLIGTTLSNLTPYCNN